MLRTEQLCADFDRAPRQRLTFFVSSACARQSAQIVIQRGDFGVNFSQMLFGNGERTTITPFGFVKIAAVFAQHSIVIQQRHQPQVVLCEKTRSQCQSAVEAGFCFRIASEFTQPIGFCVPAVQCLRLLFNRCFWRCLLHGDAPARLFERNQVDAFFVVGHTVIQPTAIAREGGIFKGVFAFGREQ